MRRPSIAGGASALLLLVTLAQAHKGVHDHLGAIHKRHRESRSKRINQTGYGEQHEQEQELVKRGGQCTFPTDAGLISVSPGFSNGGWAMSPDQPCLPGNYCPYACPPGQVSMQWDPKATSYSYPMSMHGGLYCDNNGQMSKPFPNKPYCQATANNIGVVNNAGSSVAFCQTVLPGNEAMLIPTAVDGYSALAVPGTDYWAGTAAHYYINPPGTSASDACVWGTSANPVGNWSPYVAGANVDDSGKTYLKLGWNPIYLEPTTPFRNVMPTWGVKIDCPGGECGGLPCQIDPDLNKVNGMKGDASIGAGGGSFCVVSVPKGATANFVVFQSDAGASSSGSGASPSSNRGGQFYQSAAQSSSAPASSSAPSTSSIATTTSSVSTSSSTTSSVPASSWSSWPSSSSSVITTTSTTVSSAPGSTTSQAKLTYSSETWSASNSTTETKTGPVGQPYYSLFNTSAATDSAALAASATAEVSASATGPGVLIAAATGGSTIMSWSVAAIAPLAIWSFLL